MAGQEKGLGITYYRFLLSRSISRTAWSFFMVFFMWKIVTVYHSVFLAGMIPTINLVVDLLASVPVGILIDTKNNTSLNFLASVMMLGGFLLFLIGFSVFIVYSVAAIAAFGTTLKGDSFSSIIKKHVREDGIPKATSYQQASLSISTLIGFGFGGLSLIVLSNYAALILIGLTAATLVLSVPTKEVVHKDSDRSGKKYTYRSVFSFFKKLTGFIFLALVLNGFFVTLDVYGSGLFSLYLHTSPIMYTLFVAAMPAGMFIGSMVSSRIMGILSRPVVTAGLVVLYAPILITLGLSSSPVVDIIAGGFLGLLVPLVNVPMISRLVQATPKEMFGRVFAFLKIFLGSSTPVMASFFAVISIMFPLNEIFLATGLVMLPISVLGFRVVKNYYSLTEQVIMAPEGA